MSIEGFKRKLIAILNADVKGYSQLMRKDEEATVRNITACRELIASLIQKHRGLVVDSPGDNLLAEFASVVDAVQSAVEVQKELKARNAKLPENRRMEFRIGINLGDVIHGEKRIYGDGVNIAARIESLAEGGGICISRSAYDQVKNKLTLGYEYLGEHSVKNMTEPVRVYRIVEPPGESVPSTGKAATGLGAPLPRPDTPSLAVLPFVNLSADPEQDYFSDGLTMDIMTSLVKISGLFLIGHGSMFTYKSKAVTTREIGRQLGVRHVLEGGVRKAGDRVRITAQLVEASTSRHMWAERFDRKLDDLFTVQDEITEEIVTALDVKLVSGEPARVLRKMLRNPSALESFYRGWQALFGSQKEEIEEAQRLFEETIRLESESPVGYTMAAWAHWWAAFRGLSDDFSLSLERATELARKALTLKDDTGMTNLMMAQVHLLKREHDQALAEANKAVFTRPSCHGAHAAKANILNYLDRPTEAIEFAKTAIRLTPVYPTLYPAVLASAYYGCGRYEEAITAAKEALKLDRNNLDALLVVVGANAALGQPETAHGTTREVLRVKPGFTLEEFAESQPYRNPRTLEGVINMLRRAGLN